MSSSQLWEPTIPEEGWRMFDFFSTPSKRYIKSRTLCYITYQRDDGKIGKIKYTIHRPRAWGDRSVILKEHLVHDDGKYHCVGTFSLGYMYDSMEKVLEEKERIEKWDNFMSFTWGKAVKNTLRHAGLI